METTLELPLPHLSKGRFASLDVLTDEPLFEARGIRVAFTGRAGGTSVGDHQALNLSFEVGDDGVAVEKNRLLLMEALGASGLPLIVPTQVHGDAVAVLSSNEGPACAAFQEEVEEGADAVVVEVPQVAALLCFADCVPLVIVSSTGRFAVVHAGWRGVLNRIGAKSLQRLHELDGQAYLEFGPPHYNIYIGPHIGAECFEVDARLQASFEDAFGASCIPEKGHVDLEQALRSALVEAGADGRRIVGAGLCTVCEHDRYFSYRAQKGRCGRQGAVAFSGGRLS